MPESAVAERTATELASIEPKDRTSKDWRDWKHDHEAALAREAKRPTTAPAPKPPAAPPAPPPPPSAEAAPAAEPVVVTGKVMTPVEFASEVLTRNPRDILAYQGGNSVAKLAGDMQTLYGAYLAIVSPAYLKHLRATEAKKTEGRQVFPDIGVFNEMYRVASGQ